MATTPFVVTPTPQDLKAAVVDGGLALEAGKAYTLQIDDVYPIRYVEDTTPPSPDLRGVHTVTPSDRVIITPTAADGVYVWSRSGNIHVAITELP